MNKKLRWRKAIARQLQRSTCCTNVWEHACMQLVTQGHRKQHSSMTFF